MPERKHDKTANGAGIRELGLPIIGHVRLPRAERLAFYGGLAAMTAIGILEWPVALVFGAGQALAENQHDRIIREFGDALRDT